MNPNLFLMELKRNLGSLLGWMTAITILVSGTMFIYPLFLQNQGQVMGFMTLIPKAALQFKGFSDVSALFSVIGFYAANNVVYMMLLGSIFSVVIASNILLKEEIHRTAEYLLTRPVTRTEVFFSKGSVVLLYVILLNIITSLAGLITIRIVSDAEFSLSSFIVLATYTLMLNLIFASAGMFLSTIVKRPRSITIFSIGMVLIFYIINTIARITVSVSKIGYLSPFHYADTDVTRPGYGFGLWKLIFFLGFTVLFTMLAYRMYRRKDIYT